MNIKKSMDDNINKLLLLSCYSDDNINNVKKNLINGADIQFENNKALFIASANNDEELLKFLIYNGADPYDLNYSAFRVSFQRRNLECLNILIRYTTLDFLQSNSCKSNNEYIKYFINFYIKNLLLIYDNMKNKKFLII